MGRRVVNKKLQYDTRVVAFHIVRKDVCIQLQTFATLYGLAGVSAALISECEQNIFDFASRRVEQVYKSMYCVRYYKLLVYQIMGLRPPTFIDFIIGAPPEKRSSILEDAKRAIQFGPVNPALATETDGGPHSQRSQDTVFQDVVCELDDACTDGAEDAFTEVCRKCKSNEFVEFEAKQTRSADEGMTIEYTCSKCKVRWR